MRRLLCRIFGHLISRYEFDNERATWNPETKKYVWPDGYKCVRCRRKAYVGRFV